MIHILDDLTVNKIAAGEVVEGPFSVVKELIENAIDAKANVITLEIKDGGKKYIRITDNGLGIPEAEVETAFLRHATSKISKLEDLESSISLGFRGEALASIAAVSQLEIITKPADQAYGISLEISGGKIVAQKQIGCPTGTTIIVKNLFYNTPVRLKFMKSTQGETLKITEIITRLALSKPEIAFKYINNNSIMLSTSGTGELSNAIISILDKDIYNNMLPIHIEKGEIKLHGFIGQAALARGNRNYEITFINGRYVKNKFLYTAIEAAYKEKLPINKYPLCILNLEIPPQYIDVNVHPTKTEVKFNNEDEIYQYVLEGIAEILDKEMTIPSIAIFKNTPRSSSPIYKPSIDLPNFNKHESSNGLEKTTNTINKQMILENKSIYNTDTILKPKEEQIPLITEIKQDLSLKKEAETFIANTGESEKSEVQNDFLAALMQDFKIIGQLFNTYILLEREASLYLIDQHAAHERLIYQQLMEEHNNDSVVTQSLIEPQVINFVGEDYIILMEYLDYFTSLGFEIEAFGQNTIIIRSVPLILGRPSSYQFIIEIIDEIKSQQLEERRVKELIIQKSCKQAIKAADKLSIVEIKQLLYQLSIMKAPLTCPHGRPIVLMLSKFEIEKFFKRIQ